MSDSGSFEKSAIRFCLFALLTLMMTSLAATAQVVAAGPAVTVFSPPQNISNDPGNSWVQQVAVDSKGNINVVWWDDSPGYRTVFFSRSIDGGITFSAPQSLSSDPGGTTPPNLAVDSAGNIYVVWGSWSSPGGFLTQSSDGSSFSSPVKIADNINWTPTIAIGPDESINLGWLDESQYRNVFFNRSSDGGKTFSSPVLLSTINPFGDTPLIRVDASGKIDVVWEGGFGGVSIWFSHSTDGGATFSPQASIAVLEAASVLSMALDSSGNINVVYNTVPFGNVFLARSTDGGASFTRTMVSRNNSRPFTNPRDAQIAIDSTGGIDVVWDDGGGIFFGRSTDQGATFSSQMIQNGIVSGVAPQIALDSNGNINIVWPGSSSTSYDVFFSRSNDAGATFSVPQKLSNNTITSPAPQIALDILGNPTVAWTDSSAGNSEIFFARGVTVQVPPAPPKKIPLLP